jgi:hypothetical protein
MLLTTLLSKMLSLGSVTKKYLFIFHATCENSNEPLGSIKITFPDHVNNCHFFCGDTTASSYRDKYKI